MNDMIENIPYDLHDSIKFDLDPARMFFSKAIQLAELSCKTPQTVRVADGACIKITLCNEYNGISLHKFFAKKDTQCDVDACPECIKLFIVKEGSMELIVDDDKILMPENKLFYYIDKTSEYSLRFIEDTWYYVVCVAA